jgi:hypothetical protein
MSSVLAPLFRIEERALSIGLWVKGSSKREISLPQLRGFKEALLRAQCVPRGPLSPGDILRSKALHVSTVADPPASAIEAAVRFYNGLIE